MLEPIDNHAKLGSPIAQMIITDHPMSQEAGNTTDRIAYHGRTNVAHMHRLGDVGGRIINHQATGLAHCGDPQPFIMPHFCQLIDEPAILQPQVNETGTSDFRFQAKV